MKSVVGISTRLLVRRAIAVAVSFVAIALFCTAVFQTKETMMKIGVIHPITWLAVSTWMEARGEPYLGKLAVVYTQLTRVKDKRWPDSIEDVIWQPYQFSWTNPGDPNRMKLDDVDWNDPEFQECHKAASSAFYGLEPDPTGGANHYINRAALSRVPNWYDSSKVTIVIARHEFLKL